MLSWRIVVLIATATCVIGIIVGVFLYTNIMSLLGGENTKEAKLLLQNDSLERTLNLLSKEKNQRAELAKKDQLLAFDTGRDLIVVKLDGNYSFKGWDIRSKRVSPAPSDVVQKKSLAPHKIIQKKGFTSKKTFQSKNNKKPGKKISKPKKGGRYS